MGVKSINDYLQLTECSDESIQEHDKKYHGGHYDPSQSCELRETKKRDDGADTIDPTFQGMRTSKDKVYQIVKHHLNDIAESVGIRLVDFEIHGSRARGTARDDSDLDVVFEYDDGDEDEVSTREDYVFNTINMSHPLEIDGIKVDFNPINRTETGSLEEYMERDSAYDAEILAKVNAEKKSSKSQREFEAIRKAHIGKQTWMKAPNGKPTNLSEKQWIQVRTPSFKRWFGDWENDPENASKILDENGEPRVCWKGGADGVNSFKLNFDILGFFTDKYDTADHYCDWDNPDSKPRPFFLNIRNPYVIDAKGENYMHIPVPVEDIMTMGDDQLRMRKLRNRTTVKGAWDEFDKDKGIQYCMADEVGRMIKNDGRLGGWEDYPYRKAYDGVIINNIAEGDDNVAGICTDYIPNAGRQIKSAIDNNGDFSNKLDCTK